MTELKDLGLQKIRFNINDSIIESIFAKEGDKKSRGLDIQILNNNVEIDTTGIDVEMYAVGKDKQPYKVRATAIDTSKGRYQIIYPSSILQEGTVLAELVLRKDNAIISSKKFKIEVESGIITDSAIEGHDAYPLFQKLLDAAKTIKDIDVAIEEDKRKENEKQRQDNESLRQLQEQNRQESINEIENRFNLLETSKQQDAEVINARTSTVKEKTFDSLNDRLEDTEKEVHEPLHQTIETYNDIIHLPENTTTGQVSCRLEGLTATNLLGENGNFHEKNYNGYGWKNNNVHIARFKNVTTKDNYNVLDGHFSDGDLCNRIKFNVNLEHKYFIIATVKGDTKIKKYINNGWGEIITKRNNDSWGKMFGTFISDQEGCIELSFTSSYGTLGATGRQGFFKDIMVIDVTDINATDDKLASVFSTYINGTKSTPAAIKVKSVGKNLFDTNKCLEGYANTSTGHPISHTKGEGLTSAFIPVKAGIYTSTYKNMENSRNNLLGFDLDGNKVSGVPWTSDLVNTIAMPVDGYVVLSVVDDKATHKTLNEYLNIYFPQLERSDTATEYEPYIEDRAYITAKKDNKIVNLRSLPNGTKDEINVADSRYYKKINQVVLNGSETWVKTGIDGTNTLLFELRTLTDKMNGRNNVYTDSFSFLDNSMSELWNTDIEGYCGTNANVYFRIRINKTRLNTQDVAGFKQWLQANPITLTYQLAEPEHIPIRWTGLQTYENGTVYFTPYIKDRFIVDDTKTITLQYPIKAIDKLLKLNTKTAKWEEVEGELSEDGQTITVTEEGTYEVYGEIQEGYSTNGVKALQVPINMKAQINSNTDAIRKMGNKVYADADLFTAMLLKQEMRLTILEEGDIS